MLDANYPTIIASIILLTIIFSWRIFDLSIDPGMRSLVPVDHPIIKNMALVEELFIGNEIVIIAIESENLLSRKSLEKYSAFHDSLENIISINRVASIYNHRYIVPDDGGFEIQKLLEKIPSDSIEYEILKRNIFNSGIIGSLISDMSVMCFIAQINASTDFDEINFRDRINTIINKFENPKRYMLLVRLYLLQSQLIVLNVI